MGADITNRADFLREMAERVTLREGPVGVENVLRALFAQYNKLVETPMDERTLARIARLPVPVVSALCKEFASAGVLAPGSPLRLDEPAVRVMSERWGWAAAPSSLPTSPAQASQSGGGSVRRETARCGECDGTGVVASDGTWGGVLEGLRMHNLTSAPETLVRLCALMHDDGALFGRDVLVIGGGGAVAGAVALAGRSLSPSGRLARRVVAADPHERNLMTLRDLAEREGTLIGLVRHDLRRTLPDDLREEFSTVAVTAPRDPEEIAELVERSSEAVREGGRVYLLCPPLTGEDRLDAQRAMLEMDLAIEHAIPRFDSHPGAELDLYVLRLVED
jgi:N4-bis(aminopropyl)spermidine synthase